MECGVPFCQSGMMMSGMMSGCPLQNLVPEWNDLVYHGKLGGRLITASKRPATSRNLQPCLSRHSVRQHAPAA